VSTVYASTPLLTEMQRAVVAAFRERTRHGQPPPTYRDLCNRFGWSSSATARDHLRSLVRKGVLVHVAGQSRGFHLAESETSGVPMLGRVVAGVPGLAVDEPVEHVEVPTSWLSRGATFAMRVRSDSMRDAGIIENDVVVCGQPQARPGDIVAATLDSKTTLKRLTKDRRGRLWLTSANPSYRPIQLADAAAVIHGVVIGLLRELQSKSAQRTQ
jgi:repressor LexA